MNDNDRGKLVQGMIWIFIAFDFKTKPEDILTDNPYDGHIPYDRCETKEPVDGAEKHYGRQVVLLVLGNLRRALILIVTHP